MNRRFLLRAAARALPAAALASCASGSRFPAVSAAAAGPVAWPPAAFSTVRAFAYDCDADRSVGFFQKDGRMCRGVINGGGALLTPDQTRRLLSILTVSTPRRGRTACFVPHHAFVFRNASGGVAAHAEVCFNCTTLRSFPAGLPEHVDFPALWALLQEAGVPVGPGSRYYRDLFRARGASR